MRTFSPGNACAVVLGLVLVAGSPTWGAPHPPLGPVGLFAEPAPETRAPTLPPPIPATGADGTWQRLDFPVAMSAHTAIYDPVRERMVVFGGQEWRGSRGSSAWALQLSGTPMWTRLSATGTPPDGRADHSAIYDPVRDRMLIFGGYDGQYLSDLWELRLSGTPMWTQLEPAGTPPSAREDHSAIYDPVRDRMLVFGGYDGSSSTNDVWALELSGTPTWTQLAPAGAPPSPRSSHVAIYDPGGDRMLVFGGFSGQVMNDLWELSLGGTPTWTQLTPGGSPPAPRYDHSGFDDPVRDRMVIYGGGPADYHFVLSDVWALNLSGIQEWIQIGSGPARQGHSSIYDSGRDRMVIFAGIDDRRPIHFHVSQDVWALNLAPVVEWQELGPSLPKPVLEYHTAVLDPPRNRVLVFGGLAYTGVLNETWEFSLDATPRWRMLAFDGEIPSGRYGHTAILDPARNRMLVFGGLDANGAPPDPPDSLWALDLANPPGWSPIEVSGTPPSSRRYHSAIYDPVRDRMVVFGGYGGGQYLDDVWELRLSGTPTWTQLSPMGATPSARAYHSAIYDPVGDRMLVFGGYTYVSSSTWLNDVWALSLSGTPEWSYVSPSGTPPTPHGGHSAVYDAARDRMVVFGGFPAPAGPPYLNEAWELTLSGTPAWRQLAPSDPPPARAYHAAVYDGARDRMLVFEGEGYSSLLDDVWELAFSSPLAVGGRPNVGLALSPPRPNPTSGAVSFDLDLPSTQAVRASLYDVSGREVARLADRTLAPGRHRLEWNGRARSGAKVQAGVYFLRVAAGEARLKRSLVVLH